MPDTTQLAYRFRVFAQREARRSSPLYERLCSDLASNDEAMVLMFEAPAAQRRPNLLLAAVHYLLLEGTSHPLADYYPSVGGDRAPDKATADVFIDFCDRHREAVVELLRSRPTQTNEIARAAMLLAALNHVTASAPLGLVDVGASAGLNLLCDRYRIVFGNQAIGPDDAHVTVACELVGDDPFPKARPIALAERIGLDPSPLDAGDSTDRQWLRACVWPEHCRRRRLLDAALEVAADEPPEVIEGDAFALPQALEHLSEEVHVCVFHSATLAYVAPDDRAAVADMLEGISQTRPLSWISLEGPFIAPFDRLSAQALVAPPDGAHMLLGLTEWHHGRRHDRLLGRADSHGKWLQWIDMAT